MASGIRSTPACCRYVYRTAETLTAFRQNYGALFVLLLGMLLPACPAVASAPGFAVDATFRSHLPVLVVTHAQGGVPARLDVYAAPAGENSLRDTPALSQNVFLTAESGPNVSAKDAPGKTTYIVALAPAADGTLPRDVSLAGLPESAQWRLHGSTRDKGMLRNGLAYAFGRSLFPESTPETRYCEVVVNAGGQYRYEGIYILAEDVSRFITAGGTKNGENILLEYAPRQDARQAAAQTDGGAVYLSRSLREKGFSVVYPPGGAADKELRMESAMDGLESTLHSLTPGTFLKYASLLDQTSAIDLYILNELLLNAQDSPVPYRLLGEKGRKLRLLPVWQFDGALDNAPARNRPLTFEETLPDVPAPSVLARKVPVWRRLENGGDIRTLRHYPLYAAMSGERFPWFDRLFLSRPFLSGLRARYLELRRGTLSPANVAAAVDALAETLGPALERDWARWAQEYTAEDGAHALTPYVDAQGERHIRQTHSHDQELVKIRHILREQDAFLTHGIAELNRASSDLFDVATSGNRQAGYALATVIAFLFLTHWLTRKV